MLRSWLGRAAMVSGTAAPIMDSILSGTPRTVHVNVRNGGSIAAQLLTVSGSLVRPRRKGLTIMTSQSVHPE